MNYERAMPTAPCTQTTAAGDESIQWPNSI